MDDLAATFTKHHKRLNQILAVLGRYGLADWADRGAGVTAERVARRFADPALADLSTGARMRDAAAELGTTFVKLAQMLSLRPDIVGPDIASELAQLQVAVPPDATDVARGIVAEDLGAPVEDLFATFEPDPIGSGSVAQVHGATLPDGAEVAVKILHAGVQQVVAEDLDLMRALARYVEQHDDELAQYRPTTIVAEFDTMMRGAVDLDQERANLQRFGANFVDEPDLAIPTARPGLSTSRVLTMDRLSGQAMSDREALEAAGWDVDQLVYRAAEVYLEMIFRDGVFHADPHPGNFLLLPDHRIGILDFGDVGHISAPRRDQLASLVIAVAARDVDDLTDTMLEMTTPPPDVDETKLRDDIDVWLHTYLLGDVAHLDVTGILTSWSKMMSEHKLVLPADLALLFRVLLRLQGLGRGLGTDLRLTELLTPYVDQMLAERFDVRRIAQRAVRTARSWDHLLQTFPDQVQAAFDRIRTGDVGVDVRVRDVDGTVDRLVDGVFASASLLAAAQLIARKAGPTIGGVSLAGLAVVGGGLTTWRRVMLSRPDRKSMVQRVRGIADLRGD